MTQYGSAEGWGADRLTKCKALWTSLLKLRGSVHNTWGGGRQEKRVGRR